MPASIVNVGIFVRGHDFSRLAIKGENFPRAFRLMRATLRKITVFNKGSRTGFPASDNKSAILGKFVLMCSRNQERFIPLYYFEIQPRPPSTRAKLEILKAMCGEMNSSRA